ncbi:uncharacterized protein B0I36DRAFT_350227 [Microdochium trichocladiopsis]|uniref:Secreted protein n=1 Tax=Microdochium trichocladiopsis TaxID=1682393 RepID=A0A9P8Y4R2_9PEZI|nr:uncharacterized protein B0I36DRAFT_350227 [Microdochium trichocladiopsis]KAH7029329.1 hypothetical protein B0I36DRAFT_350227 [Microdochium trichocladiopsis]
MTVRLYRLAVLLRTSLIICFGGDKALIFVHQATGNWWVAQTARSRVAAKAQTRDQSNHGSNDKLGLAPLGFARFPNVADDGGVETPNFLRNRLGGNWSSSTRAKGWDGIHD